MKAALQSSSNLPKSNSSSKLGKKVFCPSMQEYTINCAIAGFLLGGKEESQPRRRNIMDALYSPDQFAKIVRA